MEGKNGETRVKRQYFSTSGARFCRARSPRCYLADALLFDALNRKDVLSGGGELHSRPNPIAGAVGGGTRVNRENAGDAPSMCFSDRCVLCALGSFPVVSKSKCIPSTSLSHSLSHSLALSPSFPQPTVLTHSSVAVRGSFRAKASAP